MNNIVSVKLDSRYASTLGVWQYDYGQVLRITGPELPPAVEVQFSLAEKSGETLSRVGTTVDGVTEVKIPDELLTHSATSNYRIYAYIYLTDETSGNTKYEITIPVRVRSKPTSPAEDPETDPDLFRETIVAVNASAERAKMAEQNAKESATEAGKYAASASESAVTAEKTKEDALRKVGEKKQEAIEAIQNQEETSVGKITTHTDGEIQRIQNQAADSKAGLEQTITNAGVSKEGLDESIQTASDTKTALDKSVELAGTAKTELDTSIREAGTAKTALDESTEMAGTVQETLSATVKQAGALDTSLGEEIETGTQLKTDLVASGEKAVQDIQAAGSEQLGKMQAVAEAFTADREQIAKNKVDIALLKEDLGNVVKITETKSTNKLNFIDVEEQEKNGITMSYQDNVLSLNGTVPSTTEFTIPLAENLSDGIYKFYYELLEGDFNQHILYGYQSSTYAQFTKNTTTVKDISINGQTRSKIVLTKGQIFKNCKFHIWAELNSEATGMFSIPGTTQKDISLNEDLEIPQVKENESKINNIQEILETKQEYEIIDGKMVYNDGEIKSDTNSACINLKLEAGDTIVFKATGSAQYAIISESTPDFGKIINIITVGASNDEMMYKYTADQDIYLVLSCRSNKEYSIEKILYLEKLKSALLDILNTKENYRYLLKVFEGKKGLCIGDSLTYGVVNGTSSGAINTTKNYPYWFNKMTNLAVDVDGHPGWTASQMYERVKSNNYEEYSFILLFLGTNGGLTTDEQISAYKQIIEKFINDNNSIKIFLITPFTVNNYSKQDTVNQIYAIGKEKEIAVIDANIAPFKYTVIDGKIHEYDITHLSEMGYFLLANVIVDGMGKGIYDYLEKYNEC